MDIYVESLIFLQFVVTNAKLEGKKLIPLFKLFGIYRNLHFEFCFRNCYWATKRYFSSIVLLSQSHLVSRPGLNKYVLWKFDVFVLQKTCGPDCLAGTKLNCSSLMSQHKSNQDKQRVDSLVKMLILFISF